MKANHPDSSRKGLTENLYEHDFMLWIESTVQKLKSRQFSELDLDHLIDEIDSMGKRERSAVRNNLIVVLLHLLKWKYQPEKRSKSWQSSILEHRRRLEDDFEDSPSLRNDYLEVFAKCYQNACQQAAIEIGLELKTFPEESPFTPEEVLSPDFLP
jgi:hypothetical protein